MIQNQSERTKQFSMSKEQQILVRNYFINAYDDYLGARILLRNGLLQQGAILANTAIEKYFKGIMTILNVPVLRKHDISIKKYENTLRSRFRKLHDFINFKFIKLLSQCYSLRYLDDLEDNFNITIIRLKTLAELDFTVGKIEENFKIGNISNINKFEHDKINSVSELLDENFYLKSIDKTNFIEQNDKILEFRLMPNKETVHIYYLSDKIINDGQFIYEALKPSQSNPEKEFTLNFIPTKILTI